MSAPQKFRSAFNGFNREDVVSYLEYLNNKHSAQVNQLTAEADALRERLENAQPCEDQSDRIAALEQERDELAAQVEQMADRPQTDSELEAYRRAERAERIASDRVSALYQQANGALADATAKADETAVQVGDLTDALMVQLSQLQTVLSSGSNAMRDSAAALFAIRPATPDQE